MIASSRIWPAASLRWPPKERSHPKGEKGGSSSSQYAVKRLPADDLSAGNFYVSCAGSLGRKGRGMKRGTASGIAERSSIGLKNLLQGTENVNNSQTNLCYGITAIIRKRVAALPVRSPAGKCVCPGFILKNCSAEPLSENGGSTE